MLSNEFKLQLCSTSKQLDDIDLDSDEPEAPVSSLKSLHAFDGKVG